ncbi:MAG: hypothetical protein GF329_03330 [Candidatus Lokiarchaeota archaeon]|nr:hypothetical protein [Candidatus Lokiarchaeota archaeon]
MTINAIGDVASQYKGKQKKNRTRNKPVLFKAQSMRLNYSRDLNSIKLNIHIKNSDHK